MCHYLFGRQRQLLVVVGGRQEGIRGVSGHDHRRSYHDRKIVFMTVAQMKRARLKSALGCANKSFGCLWRGLGS